MSTDAPFTPPRRKISVFWWIGGVVLLLVILFFVQLLGPSPKILVSKQTTYVTEPLLPSGLPNYEEYLRQKLREGVTPQNNAAVLLSQALWSNDIKAEQYELVANGTRAGGNAVRRIGTATNVRKGHVAARSLVVETAIRETRRQRRRSGRGSVIDATLNHPWTSQQVPPMAEWVEANQKPLDLIVEASRRPRYYWPSPDVARQQARHARFLDVARHPNDAQWRPRPRNASHAKHRRKPP